MPDGDIDQILTKISNEVQEKQQKQAKEKGEKAEKAQKELQDKERKEHAATPIMLRELAASVQKGQRYNYVFLRDRLFQLRTDMRAAFQGGQWDGEVLVKGLQGHITPRQDIRRRVLTNAIQAVTSIEQLYAEMPDEGRALHRENLRSLIVDLERRIRVEEYREMALLSYVTTVHEFMQEYMRIPAAGANEAVRAENRRVAAEQMMPGFRASFAALEQQMNDMLTSLQLSANIIALRETLFASSTAIDDPARRKLFAEQHRDLLRTTEERLYTFPMAPGGTRRILLLPGTTLRIAGQTANAENAEAIRKATGLTYEVNGDILTLTMGNARPVASVQFTVVRGALERSYTMPILANAQNAPRDVYADARQGQQTSYDALFDTLRTFRQEWPAGAEAQTTFRNRGEASLETSRYVVEGRYFPIMTRPIVGMEVPQNVDQPVRLDQNPNPNNPMPVADALLLGTFIARHRAQGTEMRSLLRPGMGPTAAKRLNELESQRRAGLDRFLASSQSLFERRANIQSLLDGTDRLGEPLTVFDGDQVARLRRTRAHVNANLSDRNQLHVIAQRVRADIAGPNRRISRDTYAAGQKIFADISTAVREAAVKRGLAPVEGFLLPETNDTDMLRYSLAMLGFIAQNLNPNITRTFDAPDVKQLTALRAFYHSGAGVLARNQLERTVLSLRRLNGSGEQISERRQKIFAGLRAQLRQRPEGQALVPENASDEDVLAVLEMLDITLSPVFYIQSGRDAESDLDAAGSENVDAISQYLDSWREQVRVGRIALDAEALFEHVLTMRVFGRNLILSMDVPAQFENAVQAQSQGWVQWAVHGAQNIMPTGLGYWGTQWTEQFTGVQVPIVYSAPYARQDGLRGMPSYIAQLMPFMSAGTHGPMGDPFELLSPALIPPAAVQTEEQQQKWRKEQIEALRKMNEKERREFLEAHFSDKRLRDTVLEIHQNHAPGIQGTCRKLSAAFRLRRELSTNEQVWRPEDLVGIPREEGQPTGPVQPDWWAGAVASFNTGTVESLSNFDAAVRKGLQREGPENTAVRRRWEAAWVYREIGNLITAQRKQFGQQQADYIRALSNNFRTHIAMGAQHFAAGDAGMRDTAINMAIVGEAYVLYRTGAWRMYPRAFNFLGNQTVGRLTPQRFQRFIPPSWRRPPVGAIRPPTTTTAPVRPTIRSRLMGWGMNLAFGAAELYLAYRMVAPIQERVDNREELFQAAVKADRQFAPRDGRSAQEERLLACLHFMSHITGQPAQGGAAEIPALPELAVYSPIGRFLRIGAFHREPSEAEIRRFQTAYTIIRQRLEIESVLTDIQNINILPISELPSIASFPGGQLPSPQMQEWEKRRQGLQKEIAAFEAERKAFVAELQALSKRYADLFPLDSAIRPGPGYGLNEAERKKRAAAGQNVDTVVWTTAAFDDDNPMNAAFLRLRSRFETEEGARQFDEAFSELSRLFGLDVPEKQRKDLLERTANAETLEQLRKILTEAMVAGRLPEATRKAWLEQLNKQADLEAQRRFVFQRLFGRAQNMFGYAREISGYLDAYYRPTQPPLILSDTERQNLAKRAQDAANEKALIEVAQAAFKAGRMSPTDSQEFTKFLATLPSLEDKRSVLIALILDTVSEAERETQGPTQLTLQGVERAHSVAAVHDVVIETQIFERAPHPVVYRSESLPSNVLVANRCRAAYQYFAERLQGDYAASRASIIHFGQGVDANSLVITFVYHRETGTESLSVGIEPTEGGAVVRGAPLIFQGLPGSLRGVGMAAVGAGEYPTQGEDGVQFAGVKVTNPTSRQLILPAADERPGTHLNIVAGNGTTERVHLQRLSDLVIQTTDNEAARRRKALAYRYITTPPSLSAGVEEYAQRLGRILDLCQFPGGQTDRADLLRGLLPVATRAVKGEVFFDRFVRQLLQRNGTIQSADVGAILSQMRQWETQEIFSAIPTNAETLLNVGDYRLRVAPEGTANAVRVELQGVASEIPVVITAYRVVAGENGQFTRTALAGAGRSITVAPQENVLLRISISVGGALLVDNLPLDLTVPGSTAQREQRTKVLRGAYEQQARAGITALSNTVLAGPVADIAQIVDRINTSLPQLAALSGASFRLRALTGDTRIIDVPAVQDQSIACEYLPLSGNRGVILHEMRPNGVSRLVLLRREDIVQRVTAEIEQIRTNGGTATAIGRRLREEINPLVQLLARWGQPLQLGQTQWPIAGSEQRLTLADNLFALGQ